MFARKPAVDQAVKFLSKFFSTASESQGFKLKWLSPPSPPQRVLVTGDKELLKLYQENLHKQGIPSVFTPDANGTHGLEVWYNSLTFTKKLDEIAGHTLAEKNQATPSLVSEMKKK